MMLLVERVPRGEIADEFDEVPGSFRFLQKHVLEEFRIADTQKASIVSQAI